MQPLYTFIRDNAIQQQSLRPLFCHPFLPLPKYYLNKQTKKQKEKKGNILMKAKETGFLKGTQRYSGVITSSTTCPALQINWPLLGLNLLGWETLLNALSNSADISIVRITVAKQSARYIQITGWDSQYRVKYSCSCLKLFQRICRGEYEKGWIECPLSLETVLFH